MRRRPGIQGLQKRQAEQGQYKALGDEVATAQLARMQEQLRVFKGMLQEFAFKHRCALPNLHPPQRNPSVLPKTGESFPLC
jgi:hypothetical protein